MQDTRTISAPAPCGHVEVSERYTTTDSGLVFCSRCQRAYADVAHGISA